jgi:hypothetical protein
MNNSTSQQKSYDWLQSSDPAESPTGIELKYAVINAHTGPGRDWVAIVDLSARYGVPIDPPEFWQIYRLKASGHETILLSADTFYRAKIGGEHLACTLMWTARSNISPRGILSGNWIGGSAIA